MKLKKSLSLVLAVVLGLMMMAGCGSESSNNTQPPASQPASAPVESAETPSQPAESLGKIRVAWHPGSNANSGGFFIDYLELDKKYNFDYETVITTGPNIYTALVAGELDVGFLGNGMAWHYFEPDSKIAVLTLDNLTNDDRLLVRTGMGISENESIETLAEKLPGMTMACDLTTTPGTFLRSLVNEMNKGKDEADMIWYEDVERAYPVKGSPDKQITILNTTNANLVAAMQDPSVDCCIPFSSIRVTLEKDTEHFVTAATTFTHLTDTITPSTWAVSRDFAEKNPELLQAFVNALVEAKDYASDNSPTSTFEERVHIAMPFDQLDEEDYIQGGAYYPNKEELREYYATDDGMGFTYMEQIRASHIGFNGLEEDTALSAQDALLIEFIRNATAD